MTPAHDVTGSGPAVLLIHSTVCDRRMWDPQVPALVAAGYLVVRCDLRGYGESPLHTGPNDDTAEVAGLLTSLGIARTAVIGASGGGQVALELAARWRDRVTVLALLCTALPGHDPSPRLRAFGEREDALLEAGDVDAATELNVDLWLGPEADEKVRAQVREMQRHAFDVQLAAEEPQPGPSTGHDEAAEPENDQEAGSTGIDLSSITAPALLISGAHDLPDFRDIAVHLAGVLPDARHLDLDWAGHLPSMERPDLLNPLLISFLAEHR